MHIDVDVSQAKPFVNNVGYCVGTGHMGMALRQDYQEHLMMVQRDIGFSYIRGHGLFGEDMGILRVQKQNGRQVITYNFMNLDKVFDMYLRMGVKPFIELGFMPKAIASGERTIFFWQGNVTPPREMALWQELVEHTLRHLIDRYGIEQVAQWPIEVWNEPNIPPFWAGDMKDYFDLYRATAQSVKRVSPRLRVGGPAICGVDTERWLNAFFTLCQNESLPLDFVARHCYTANSPTREGQYTYHTMMTPMRMPQELQQTHDIMARYEHVKNLPLYITEFNSSYNSRAPIHDTAFGAAYIAHLLAYAGDGADGYSYWTFSDVFEEEGLPVGEFHGGFGLVTMSGIKKPTYYAFEWTKKLGDTLLYRDERCIVTKRSDGAYAILAWHYDDGMEAVTQDGAYTLRLPACFERAVLVKQSVGSGVCDPLQTWSDLGKPRALSAEQLDILKKSAQPKQETGMLNIECGMHNIDIALETNQLCFITVLPAPDFTDTYDGFDAKWFYGLK